MTDTTDLIVLPKGTDIAALYGGAESPSKIDETIERIRKRVRSQVPDISTAKGRDAIKKLAADVSRSKKALEDAGLGLTKQWRDLTAAVNVEKKRVVEELDALRDEARKPLTDWEEKEAAAKAERFLVLSKLQPGHVASHMAPLDIATEIDWLVSLEIDESWGDDQAVALVMIEECKEAWQAVFVAATQRVADEAELAELRREREERAASDAKAAEERAAAKAAEQAKAAALEAAERAHDAHVAQQEQRLEKLGGTLDFSPGQSVAALTKQQAIMENWTPDEDWGDLKSRAAEKVKGFVDQTTSLLEVATAEAEKKAAEDRTAAAEAAKIAAERLAAERQEQAVAAERQRVEDEAKATAAAAEKRAADKKHRARILAAIAEAVAKFPIEDLPQAMLDGEIPHVTVAI